MHSPVLRMALGECNAIKDRGFGHVELTSASTLEAKFVDRRYCECYCAGVDE
jgi:hypothetical protein